MSSTPATTTYCQFPADPPREGDGWRLRCRECGHSDLYPTPRAVRRCRGMPPRKPNFARKLKSFTGALFRLARSGQGLLSEDEIEERLWTCRQCPHFRGNKCRLCGCRTKGKRSLADKLAYPTESCPDDPPRWGPIDHPAVSAHRRRQRRRGRGHAKDAE